MNQEDGVKGAEDGNPKETRTPTAYSEGEYTLGSTQWHEGKGEYTVRPGIYLHDGRGHVRAVAPAAGEGEGEVTEGGLALGGLALQHVSDHGRHGQPQLRPRRRAA
eukprot:2563744-Pyramimonas_sp.AAC.1